MEAFESTQVASTAKWQNIANGKVLPTSMAKYCLAMLESKPVFIFMKNVGKWRRLRRTISKCYSSYCQSTKSHGIETIIKRLPMFGVNMSVDEDIDIECTTSFTSTL